jgi:YD repeat-containing protein
MTTISTTYLLLLGAAMATSAQAGSFSACDINQDGTTNVGDVQGLINQALGVTQATIDLNEDGVINVVDVQIVINAVIGLGCSASTAPAITGFSPQSAPVGTVITVTGTHLQPNTGTAAQFTLAQQGGGTMTGFASSGTATTLLFIVPAGAATGVPSVTVNGQTAIAATPLTILPSATFSLNATPGTANLIQGQSASFAINLTSTTGFDALAALSVGGIPAGVTTAFKPQSITAGQTSILTLTSSGSQPIATLPLAITATAMVTGLPVTQTGNVSLMVTAPTTSFLGRTVISDTMETPLAGVTITMLGLDGNGNTTGCSGGTVSDGAGNFLLANLPASCVGPQLVGFNGTTVTAPPGIYAGVNLVYTFVAGQVTASPVLVHLPRIDTVETFNVTQNASVNQTHAFVTIPGLSVTVYAGTIFTLQDGTQPNPFPLAAVQVPPDRLPDLKPNVPTMIRAFIVAFQPANATTNQPVAVYFPNTLNTAPGTDMVLMTLDPTHGQMVPYGTGAVSLDSTQIVPDADPAHAGHLYGLVHFDWHGPMPPGPTGPGPGPGPGCPGCCAPPGGGGPGCGGGGGDPGGGGPVTGDPVDLSSGLQVIRATDIAVRGKRGSILITRTYRGISSSSGPFGIGTNHNYGYQLATSSFINGQGLITLVMPDGDQYPFTGKPYGALTNSTIPTFIGAVMTSPSSLVYNLRMKDGTTWIFGSPRTGALIAYMDAIVDSNGNTITLVHGNSASPVQITQVTDPVGRALSLTYDASDRIVSITDPIGRTVGYTYNALGTLSTVTDAAGGVTRYAYDGQNRMSQITDARGIVVAQNTYDVNGRVIQQVQADGGVINIAYILLNSLVATSPVLLTAVTDALGNVSSYHFDPSGFLLDVTDPLGQMRIFSRNVQQNNLVSSVTGGGSCPVCGNPLVGDLAFTYDANGNLATRTDSLGNTTTTIYEPVFNRVTSSTDPLGNVTRFTYDARGNQLTRTDANGNTSSFIPELCTLARARVKARA